MAAIRFGKVGYHLLFMQVIDNGGIMDFRVIVIRLLALVSVICAFAACQQESEKALPEAAVMTSSPTRLTDTSDPPMGAAAEATIEPDRGRIEVVTVSSPSLADAVAYPVESNDVFVYLPPGYDSS